MSLQSWNIGCMYKIPFCKSDHMYCLYVTILIALLAATDYTHRGLRQQKSALSINTVQVSNIKLTVQSLEPPKVDLNPVYHSFMH